MNHKKHKPKSARSGCLLCHPHKHQAIKHTEKSKKKHKWKEIELIAAVDNYHYHKH